MARRRSRAREQPRAVNRRHTSGLDREHGSVRRRSTVHHGGAVVHQIGRRYPVSRHVRQHPIQTPRAIRPKPSGELRLAVHIVERAAVARLRVWPLDQCSRLPGGGDRVSKGHHNHVSVRFWPKARSRCLCQNGNDAYAAAAMANDEADALRQEIGKRMRQARTDVLGEASLGVMSDRLGVSRSEISRWETGVRSPSAVDFVRFARVLSVPPEKVLSGIAPARQHQMTLVGLDVPAAKVVRRLVHLLRERKAS
jgi:transcriptional regulator with XRE-family HTH domain